MVLTSCFSIYTFDAYPHILCTPCLPHHVVCGVQGLPLFVSRLSIVDYKGLDYFLYVRLSYVCLVCVLCIDSHIKFFTPLCFWFSRIFVGLSFSVMDNSFLLIWLSFLVCVKSTVLDLTASTVLIDREVDSRSISLIPCRYVTLGPVLMCPTDRRHACPHTTPCT